MVVWLRMTATRADTVNKGVIFSVFFFYSQQSFIGLEIPKARIYVSFFMNQKLQKQISRDFCQNHTQTHGKLLGFPHQTTKYKNYSLQLFLSLLFFLSFLLLFIFSLFSFLIFKNFLLLVKNFHLNREFPPLQSFTIVCH